IFIQKGANVDKVSEGIKRKFGKGVTLLHLAVLTPEEMEALTRSRPPKQRFLVDSIKEQNQKKLLSEDPFNICLRTLGGEPLAQKPYEPREILELLLEKGLKSALNTQANEVEKKTVLDWAMERYFLWILNHRVASESDLKIENGYQKVIELLLESEAKHNGVNDAMYGQMMLWEMKCKSRGTNNLVRHPEPLQRLKQWRQNLEKH
ncbi:MAG: hypothetical protein LBI77_01040, partial [Puniceicoccales bacterium]|nr:hypothetical protein [Puniceicoccales bacterium]